MEKGEKNHNFWEILRGGTGTKQSGTGTISILSTGIGTEFSVPVPNVLFLNQCLYCGHNLVISYPM